jgi:transcriptional regulator with XRE-family HTH domain
MSAMRIDNDTESGNAGEHSCAVEIFTSSGETNHRMQKLREVSVGASDAARDRHVTRCLTCGLVQYFTKSGYCRKCLRMLPRKVEFRVPPSAPPVLEETTATLPPTQNRLIIENIGQRIRQLRESRGMTQSVLTDRSHVSRSYVSRIESGQMTPSLGTLEKISEALGVGFSRFFDSEWSGENLIRDAFIRDLRPFLRRLDYNQWQSVLIRLRAISGNVEEVRKSA